MSDVAAAVPTLDTPMGPVVGQERIDLIDVLRGMALFGILAANMRGFFAPLQAYFDTRLLWSSGIDGAVQSFINLMIQGKFVSLFSFLFGLGFAVQMERATARGRPVSFYPRRLFILLVFGLIHGLLIWWGDILLFYALGGFMLLAFRQRSQKTVATWGVCCFALFLVMLVSFDVAALLGRRVGDPPKTFEQQKQIVDKAIAAHRAGVVSHLRENLHEWGEAGEGPEMIAGFLGFLLPRFLAGLWVYRTGVVRNPAAYLPVIRRVWLWAGITGFSLDALLLYIRYFVDIPRTQPNAWIIPRDLAHELAPPLIALFYACSVALLLQSAAWARRLKPFAAVGRMALTDYLTQSCFFVTFFLATGLYGKIGPAIGAVLTVVFFAIQLAFSNWWLQRYQFGPMEWLWRSLTYGKMQPFRRIPHCATDSPMVAEA